MTRPFDIGEWVIYSRGPLTIRAKVLGYPCLGHAWVMVNYVRHICPLKYLSRGGVSA